MILEVRLKRFKNFRDASLAFDGSGPLTLLIGTNASGKSNLRDAFRFLHGVSRGYTLADIIGEKWTEGGSLEWKGIRGGIREATYRGARSFLLETTLGAGSFGATYTIEVEVSLNGKPPRVVRESLWCPGWCLFDSHPADEPPKQEGPDYLVVRFPSDATNREPGKSLRFPSKQPVLSQIDDHPESPRWVIDGVRKTLKALGSMRFLDLAPEAMRIPSLPGQDTLGDRGENLSSVLQSICERGASKDAVLEWIRELTPSDVTDIEFVADQTGKILLTLVESDGQRISAYSASDGTLRFLAMIAAMLGAEPAKFYFVEELENGIHPTRLHLLLQLIEQSAGSRGIQVVATSHSPQLLGFLSEKSRASAALVYRLEGQPDARIRRILEIPEAIRVLQEQDLASLHSSGWLEDTVAFLEGDGQ